MMNRTTAIAAIIGAFVAGWCADSAARWLLTRNRRAVLAFVPPDAAASDFAAYGAADFHGSDNGA